MAGAGWCPRVFDLRGDGSVKDWARCRMSTDGGGVNARFDHSYGVWGGFANAGSSTPTTARFNTDIICR